MYPGMSSRSMSDVLYVLVRRIPMGPPTRSLARSLNWQHPSPHTPICAALHRQADLVHGGTEATTAQESHEIHRVCACIFEFPPKHWCVRNQRAANIIIVL